MGVLPEVLFRTVYRAQTLEKFAASDAEYADWRLANQ